MKQSGVVFLVGLVVLASLSSAGGPDSTATVVGHLPEPDSKSCAVWIGQEARIIGGDRGGVVHKDIVKYSPGGETVKVAELPIPIRACSAVYNPALGLIYIFGGHDGASWINRIYAYDPLLETITRLPFDLPSARGYTAAVWTGTEALVIGGENGGGVLSSVVRYNPALALVREENVLPNPTAAAMAVYKAPTTYVFGGRDAYLNAHQWIYRIAETPNDQLGVEWMNGYIYPSIYSGSAVFGDNTFFLFGGITHGGLGTTDAIQAYDGHYGSNSARVGDMPAPISHTTAVWSGTKAYTFAGEYYTGAESDWIVRFDP